MLAITGSPSASSTASPTLKPSTSPTILSTLISTEMPSASSIHAPPTYNPTYAVNVITEPGANRNAGNTSVAVDVANLVNTAPSHWRGDGQCDAILNSDEFDFDGGDCCEETCIQFLYLCDGDFDCKDPQVLRS